MMGHMGTHGVAPALYPNLKYKPEDHGKTQSSIGQKIKENWKIDPPENCASCHR